MQRDEGQKVACRAIVGETSTQLKTVMWSCCDHSKNSGTPRTKYSKLASDHVHVEKLDSNIQEKIKQVFWLKGT